MDLVLGRFFDREGGSMDDDALTEFEALLEENDQDLYDWISGRVTPPARHSAIIARIASGGGGLEPF